MMARDRTSSPKLLLILGTASFLVYVLLAWLSAEFVETVPTIERPIVQALALFGIAFAFYVWAIRESARLPDRVVKPILLGFAVVFRLVLLPSEPIQEVDIYRYIWDGHVAAAGVSPYRFSPTEVKAAVNGKPEGDLRTVANLAKESRGLEEILRRVHFGDLRSPYPPTSQAVFTLSAAVSPNSATATSHVRTMKFLITLFDILALLALMGILQHIGKPIGWALVYGWCPLVMKEFANGGHLDSIAVCFTVLAVYFFVRTVIPKSPDKFPTRNAVLSSVFLGLAVGAKYFPLVLAPLFLVMAWRRVGPRKTLLSAAVFLATTSVCLAPTMAAVVRGHLQSEAGERNGDGLTAFLQSWEMNDFLFMGIVENLKTPDDLGKQPEAWFSVVPTSLRQPIRAASIRVFGERGHLQSFFTTRAITGVLYCLVLGWVMSRMGDGEEEFLRAVFLVIAWFWLLSPAQNPWYWTWALPFVCFARGKAWIAISGATLIYYLRFWFGAHFANQPVWGTPYQGSTFFDLVIPWIEFGPILIWVAWETWRTRFGSEKAVDRKSSDSVN